MKWYDGGMSNYYGEKSDFDLPPQPSSNTAVVVIIVLVAAFGMVFLVCAGLFGLGYVAQQNAVREMQEGKEVAQREAARAQQVVELEQSLIKEFNGFVQAADYESALKSVEKVIKSNPNHAMAHNNKAWLLCTCPVDEYRNGELAIEHAEMACELTNYENFMYVDTLAAAHAEAGNFDEAVRWQAKAVDLMPSDGFDQPGIRERLDLFKSGKPYREGPVPETTPLQPSEPATADLLTS